MGGRGRAHAALDPPYCGRPTDRGASWVATITAKRLRKAKRDVVKLSFVAKGAKKAKTATVTLR